MSYSPPNLPKLEVLVTAEEAFPVLERAFLSARQEIVAGFRVFDPATKLRSQEACAIGSSWADLIRHTLNRGVNVTLLIGDFDPINATDLHRGTWQAIRKLDRLRNDLAPEAGRFEARALLHPARIGLVPRLVFALMARRKLRDRLRDAREREADLFYDAPGLRHWCCPDAKDRDAPCVRLFALPHQFPASHHHKLAVFDQEQLYIGGLDVNERRYDTPQHDQPTQQTWHDVQLMATDPALARAGRNYLLNLADAVSGANPSSAPTHFLRTLSQKRHLGLLHISPRRKLREIRAAHFDEIARAERFIYLETQFLRDLDITRALCKAARLNPELTLIVTLPGAPEDVAFHGSAALETRFGENLQARCIAKLRRAFGDRLFVGSPVQPRPVSPLDVDEERAQLSDTPLIYVHAKVSIFDQRAAIVSSANLNGRSMNWDSEAGLLLRGAQDVAQVTRRVMGHWLPDGGSDQFFAPETALAAWRDLARHNDGCAPQDQQGFIVPYKVGPARKFGVSVPGVPDEMV